MKVNLKTSMGDITLELDGKKADGSKFLSLIAPTEWAQKYLYSGTLNSDGTWSKV